MSYVSKLYPGETFIDDDHDVDSPALNDPSRLRGYKPRDYSKMPHGSMPFAGKFDLPLIPRNEWPDRIAELEKTKTRLSDILLRAGIPSLDQNGTNYCTTEDTEVLTEKGWVQWPNYNWSDLLGTINTNTGMLEFQPCLEKHVYEHKGKMIYSTNKAVDFGVTPDHRMLVRKWDEKARKLSNKFEFQRAADLGWYFGLPHATKGHIGTDLVTVKVEGDREYSGDDFAAIVSLVVSDGYAGGTENTKNWVSFACFTERRKQVAELAERNGFKECPSRPGVWIRYDAGALANWLRKHCYTGAGLGSQNKKVPQIIKEMCSRQIRHFLNFYGDQSHNMENGRAYFSTSKRCIDDLQELLLRVGKRGSVWSEERQGKVANLSDVKTITSKYKMWHLHERAVDRLSIDRKKHLEQESYNGAVYCATVPNGTLITRRNGTMLISGNCWANGVVSAIIAINAASHRPYVSLSPASVAAQIKNFRNQGGWGSQALSFIVANGVASTELWPANAIDRRYLTPAMKENAALHKIVSWYDLRANDFNQLMTCLLLRIPVAIGLDWWGHEVCAMDPVMIGSSSFGTRIRNSWGDSYGFKGFAVLSEQKSTPDDAVAPKVATTSYK